MDLSKLQSDLKKVIGVTIEKYIRSNFDNEGFDGKKWKLPKRRLDPKTTNDTKKVLFQSGKLKKSFRKETTKPSEVRIFTDVPYASKNNKTRPFVGNSPILKENIEKEIGKYLKRVATNLKL